MEVTQLLRVGLGLVVGLKPQYSHPVCMTTNLSIQATSNNYWEFVGFSSMGNSLAWEKHHTGNFSVGMGKVQTLQTNQSHNNDIMNVNR